MSTIARKATITIIRNAAYKFFTTELTLTTTNQMVRYQTRSPINIKKQECDETRSCLLWQPFF